MSFAPILLDIIFVAVAVILILVSAKRGFIANLIRSARWILSIVLAYLLGTQVGKLFFDWFIHGAVRGAVYGRVEALYLEAEAAFGAEKVSGLIPKFLLTEELQARLAAAEGSGLELVNTLTDVITSPIATLLSNLLGYVAVFVLSLIGLWFVVKIVDGLAKKIKLLDRINTLLGFLWGLVLALMLLLMAASVVKLFFGHAPIYLNSFVVRFFGDSFLLQALRFLDVGGVLLKNLLG